jgi:hypothetical protein
MTLCCPADGYQSFVGVYRVHILSGNNRLQDYAVALPTQPDQNLQLIENLKYNFEEISKYT